jgi:cobalt-precorrin-5B (C1)-methyltransferase
LSSIKKNLKQEDPMFNNTHNKFGMIDFERVKQCLREELGVVLEDEEFATLKGVLEVLPKSYHEVFIKRLTQKAAKQLQHWLDERGVSVACLELVTLPNKIQVRREMC